MNNDEDLRLAVQKVFEAYDIDKNGTLQLKQVLNLITDALQYMKSIKKVSIEEVKQFISIVDTDGDGNIGKQQLFKIFQKVIKSEI